MGEGEQLCTSTHTYSFTPTSVFWFEDLKTACSRDFPHCQEFKCNVHTHTVQGNIRTCTYVSMSTRGSLNRVNAWAHLGMEGYLGDEYPQVGGHKLGVGVR